MINKHFNRQKTEETENTYKSPRVYVNRVKIVNIESGSTPSSIHPTLVEVYLISFLAQYEVLLIWRYRGF